MLLSAWLLLQWQAMYELSVTDHVTMRFDQQSSVCHELSSRIGDITTHLTELTTRLHNQLQTSWYSKGISALFVWNFAVLAVNYWTGSLTPDHSDPLYPVIINLHDVRNVHVHRLVIKNFPVGPVKFHEISRRCRHPVLSQIPTNMKLNNAKHKSKQKDHHKPQQNLAITHTHTHTVFFHANLGSTQWVSCHN